MPRYECSSPGHNKFWEIEIDGKKTTVTFGKIGSDGRKSVKDHPDAAKAQKFMNTQTRSKVKEGYVAVSGQAEGEAADSSKKRSSDGAEKKAKKPRTAFHAAKLVEEMRSLKMVCGSNESDGEATVFDIDLGGKTPKDVFEKSGEVLGQTVTQSKGHTGDAHFTVHQRIEADLVEKWNLEDDPDDSEQEPDDEKVKEVVNHLNSSADSAFSFARQQDGGSGCEFITGFGVVIGKRAIGWAQTEVAWT